MYLHPLYLPQVSNREDYLLTVSLFDDDTGDPIKIDGCTTVNPQPFTGISWQVLVGALSLVSNTPITIPIFPISTQAQLSLSILVPLGQTIAAGSPVSIRDVASLGANRMDGYVLSYSATTGIMVVQIGTAFLFEIRRNPPRNSQWDYDPWYDFGTIGDTGPLIQATIGNGIAIVDIGVIEIRVPVLTFQKLFAGTYGTALVMSDSVNTRQIFVASLPVIFGGVVLPSSVGSTATSSNLFILDHSKLDGTDVLG